jgi:Fe-S oxidoreductase
VRPLRRLLQRWPGIAAARPLPRFTRRHLLRWFRRQRVAGSGVRGPVTFLADSFTTFTEPEIGIAAVRLLERAGWTVRLADSGCCGRASLSKGLLADAARQARSLVDALARTEGPIVGCEPSCLLTLTGENRALLGGDERVAEVGARARLVEELLVEAIDAGDLVLREDAWPAGRKILFHGHCHQKAEVGTAATVALLRRIPGAEVVELDAGCCGMAGSFGFEAEHYDVSMTIGEDRLFPAVRTAEPDTVVAATGVSCRQQIAHGTARVAHHPVELALFAAAM